MNAGLQTPMLGTLLPANRFRRTCPDGRACPGFADHKNPPRELITTLELLPCSRFCEYCERARAEPFTTITLLYRHLKQAHSYFLTRFNISIVPEFGHPHQPFNLSRNFPQSSTFSQATSPSTRGGQKWSQRENSTVDEQNSNPPSTLPNSTDRTPIEPSTPDNGPRNKSQPQDMVSDGPRDNRLTLTSHRLSDEQDKGKGKKRSYEESDDLLPGKEAQVPQLSSSSKIQRTQAPQRRVIGQANNPIRTDSSGRMQRFTESQTVGDGSSSQINNSQSQPTPDPNSEEAIRRRIGLQKAIYLRPYFIDGVIKRGPTHYEKALLENTTRLNTDLNSRREAARDWSKSYERRFGLSILITDAALNREEPFQEKDEGQDIPIGYSTFWISKTFVLHTFRGRHLKQLASRVLDLLISAVESESLEVRRRDAKKASELYELEHYIPILITDRALEGKEDFIERDFGQQPKIVWDDGSGDDPKVDEKQDDEQDEDKGKDEINDEDGNWEPE